MTLADALARFPGAETYRPGDSPVLNAEIIALMRSGKKTASCAFLPEFGPEGEAMPQVGRTDIVLDWQGNPALATRTTHLETFRFRDMDEARVPPQGEFRDLDHWRKGYQAYLTRTHGFDPDMDVLYERFELVADFGASNA